MNLKNACQSSMNLFTKNDQNCVIPENIYTPHGGNGNSEARGESSGKHALRPSSLECLPRSNFSSWAYIFKISRYAPALTKRLIEDDQKVPKIECVKFTVNLTFQLKVTDSVALK